MGDSDVKFRFVPETAEVDKALANVSSKLDSVGKDLTKSFAGMRHELEQSTKALDKMHRMAKDIGQGLRQGASDIRGALSVIGRLGGGLGSLGSLQVPGGMAALAIGGAVAGGAAYGLSRFSRQGDVGAAFGGGLTNPNLGVFDRISRVVDSLDHTFTSMKRDIGRFMPGSGVPEEEVRFRNSRSRNAAEVRSIYMQLENAEYQGDQRRKGILPSGLNLTNAFATRTEGVPAYSNTPEAQRVRAIQNVMPGWSPNRHHRINEEVRVETINADRIDVRAIGAAAGAASALFGGGGIGGMLHGALGGAMFAPLGARLAARFSDNSVVQGASAAGAGVLGASVFGGLISKAQELAPMAMEYRAGVSRATLGGWGEPLGRSGRSTRRNYGLGLLQLSRELPELAGHFPGAFGGHEGNDFAGGLGQTLGIGFSGVSQLVQPMLSMRGGGRIFSGMGSEGAAGAGEARNELLRRLFTDAQAAGMERALPEFAQAVTEGVASATRGLLYTTEQIRNIQTRVSIHTSELVQQGMTAAQAAKLAAGFQAGPGQLADMFLRGGYTPELEMASTYQAMRGLGVRGNDEFLRSLTSMSTGESSAAPLYAGLLQQAFRPGTSEFGQRAQSAMVGARMGLDPRQAYQQVYTPFRQRFMERGQVTADDVREILRADQPGRDPASDTTTATGRMQELMRGEGAGVRALADFQNRQLHLALKLVHLGTASLNVETAMLALMARGANRAGGDWSVNMMRQATTYMNELAAGRHPTLPRGMGVYGDIVELAAGAFQTATGDLPPPGTAGTGGRSGPDQ